MNRAGFGVGASFQLSYTVLKGNSGISKNNGTLSQTPDLENFASIVEKCYHLSSTK